MNHLQRPRRFQFVLIHGAWTDGKSWTDLAAKLRRLGHTVHTPTLAGHGPTGDRSATHADAVASAATYIDEHDLDGIVLVGHSFGGTIIAKLAEQMPERIRRLVFHDAFVLEDGHSIFDELPPALVDLLRSLERDGTIMLPYRRWREVSINDADERLARHVYQHMSPEPIRMLTDRLDLARFHQQIANGELACSYLHALEDTALPQGPYGWHPRYTNRLGACRLIQMHGSHNVAHTAPDRLAAKLLEAARD